MVALAVALASAIVGQVVLVAYLVHALLGSQRERDAAVKLYRDAVEIGQQYLDERNDRNARVIGLQAERSELHARLGKLTAELRASNARMVAAIDRQLDAGTARDAAAAVDELLASPLPGVPSSEASAAGDHQAEPAVRPAAASAAGDPGRGAND